VLAWRLAGDDVREEFHTPVSAALDEVADTVTEGSPEVYAEIQRAFDGADDVAWPRRPADRRFRLGGVRGPLRARPRRPRGTGATRVTRPQPTTTTPTATDDTTTQTDDAATETRTNMIDREAVRNNANYLRNVRPIDPEEIAEYIEGSPHPAVVRETLPRGGVRPPAPPRARDGAFEPVSEEPVPAPGWAPTALPENYSFALEDLLVREFGANWHREESGDKLREAVRRLKDDYLYGNDVAYDRVAALGYAIYHLPAYYATIGYVLDDLTENGLLDRTLRVLDVGAGVGGPALGLHDYPPMTRRRRLPRRRAERSRRRARPDARRDGAELPADDPRGDGGVLLWDRRRGKSGDNDPDEFDLVVFGNVLSELDDPVAVVEAALGRLADDGSVVAFAPADRNTAMGLREVERAVATPRPASRRTRPRSGSGRTRPPRTVGGHSTWPTTSISRRSSAGSTRPPSAARLTSRASSSTSTSSLRTRFSARTENDGWTCRRTTVAVRAWPTRRSTSPTV